MTLPTAWLFAPTHVTRIQRVARRNTSIGGLSFGIEVDGENVAMRISEAALRQCFGAQRCRSTWLATYRRHAAVIDARAAALHRMDPLRPVCLEAADFASA